MKRKIYSLGHSDASLAEFMELLREHAIEQVADVRRFPRSRRYPHFCDDVLRHSLERNGVRYRHFPNLGGYRKERSSSPHTALDNSGFRAYADYMLTPEFREATRGFLEWANGGVTTFMCAESSPECCHRRFLSDSLVTEGLEVEHVGRGRSAQAHEVHPLARRTSEGLIYDSGMLNFGG